MVEIRPRKQGRKRHSGTGGKGAGNSVHMFYPIGQGCVAPWPEDVPLAKWATLRAGYAGGQDLRSLS